MRFNRVELDPPLVRNKRRPWPPDTSGVNPVGNLAQTAALAVHITFGTGHVGTVGTTLSQTAPLNINVTFGTGALSQSLRQRYPLTVKVSFPSGALLSAERAFTMFIDGRDVSPFILRNSLQINNQLSQATTASFAMFDRSGAVPVPAVGQEVLVYHGTLRIFGGGVEQPVQTAYQALGAHLFSGSGGSAGASDVGGATSGGASGGVQCTDFSYLLTRRYVGKTYAINAFLAVVVQDIVDTYLAADGFSYDPSDGQPDIDMGPNLLFNWVTVQQAFNTISSNTGWEFTVDYYKVIRFYPAGSGTGPAPFSIVEDGQGNVPTVLAETLSLAYSRGQYRNRQGIRSPTQSSFLWQDIFSAAQPGPFPNSPQPPDGIRTDFITLYGILATPQVFVNGAPQVVISILDVATSGGAYDWYWIPQQGFPAPAPGVFQNQAHTPLSPTDVLTVNYSSQLSPIYWVQDNAQIAERAAIEGNTGIYEDVEDAPSTTDPAAIATYAQGLLDRYGKNGIPYTVNYSTDSDGLFAGMLQEIMLTNPAIALLAGLVIGVQIRDVDGVFLRYGVSVASNQYQGNWTQFFAALVTASQFPQPGNFVTYVWDIGQSVPGLTNPGTGTGTQPGIRVVGNAIELIQSFKFSLPNAVAGLNQITLLVNGSGVFSLQIEFVAGETGTKTAYVPSSSPLRVYAGDTFAVFVGGAGGVIDGVATLVTAIAVT